MGSWTIQEVGQPTDITEVMWNTSGDEHRENTLRGIPFTISLNPRDPSDVSGSGRTAGVAEAALKVNYYLNILFSLFINLARWFLELVGKTTTRMRPLHC